MLPILTLSVMGCSDDDDGTWQDSGQPLVLQGQAYTFNSEEGAVWHNAQEIGVFLTETGQETVCGDYANLKFYADNRNSFGYFVPSGDPVYLNGEQTVDIKAYYPYKDISLLTQGTHYIYNIPRWWTARTRRSWRKSGARSNSGTCGSPTSPGSGCSKECPSMWTPSRPPLSWGPPDRARPLSCP